MGRLRAKLLRLRDQYNLYLDHVSGYESRLNKGELHSLKRRIFFEKNKLNSTLKDIENEIHPHLYQARIQGLRGHVKKVIMALDDIEDVKLYLKYLGLIHREDYLILDIKELPSIEIEHD